MGHPVGRDNRKPWPAWLFWLSWVVGSAAAILVGVALMYASIFIGKAVLGGFNEDRVADGIILPILASVLGVSQWLVLRRALPKSGWWIPATAAGLLAGIALGVGAVQAITHITGQQWNWDDSAAMLVVYAPIGLVVALAQLPVLRNSRGFALWLLPSLLGWAALALIIGKSIDRTSDILALGAVPAAFTGLCLVWLLRRPRVQLAPAG